jgi:WD40 repeat protein
VADVSADGRVFARCDGPSIVIGDVASGQERRTLAVDFYRSLWLQLSEDGRMVAVQSGPSELRLWNTQSGTPAGRLVCPGSGVVAVRFSPHAAHVAAVLQTVAQSESSVVIWDLERGEQPIASQGFSSVVRSLAYHPSGQLLAVGLTDATIEVLDALTGREVLTLRGHRGMVRALAFSRDGRLLASAADDRTVRLWDTRPFAQP